MSKYVCAICGFVYDEAVGIPSAGIAAGTLWESLPDSWECPICGASKSAFKKQEEEKPAVAKPVAVVEDVKTEDLRQLSIGEVTALCSNLAKGCEKQYLTKEAALFTELAVYFKSKTPKVKDATGRDFLDLVEKDLNENFVTANEVATANLDRGAKRALVWSEKVTRILDSILARFSQEGDAFLQNTNVFVCETCGFVYVGDEAPALCPVCKVPNWKILKVERR